MTNSQDDALLTKLNAAVKAANEAETSVTTAQAELVSRSKAVGLLLLEAKKLHPQVKDFEAYLKRVDGLKLSRAYDLLRLAGGRTTDAELRKEAAERQRKSRAKSKTLPKPEPKSAIAEAVSRVATAQATEAQAANKPKKDSVTVTETAEESAERRKAQAAAWSAWNLDQFMYACRTYLPKLSEDNLKKARAYVTPRVAASEEVASEEEKVGGVT
jgi:hypothetical protein